MHQVGVMTPSCKVNAFQTHEQAHRVTLSTHDTCLDLVGVFEV